VVVRYGMGISYEDGMLLLGGLSLSKVYHCGRFIIVEDLETLFRFVLNTYRVCNMLDRIRTRVVSAYLIRVHWHEADGSRCLFCSFSSRPRESECTLSLNGVYK
jgi:hypothetical protein